MGLLVVLVFHCELVTLQENPSAVVVALNKKGLNVQPVEGLKVKKFVRSGPWPEGPGPEVSGHECP